MILLPKAKTRVYCLSGEMMTSAGASSDPERLKFLANRISSPAQKSSTWKTGKPGQTAACRIGAD